MKRSFKDRGKSLVFDATQLQRKKNQQEQDQPRSQGPLLRGRVVENPGNEVVAGTENYKVTLT